MVTVVHRLTPMTFVTVPDQQSVFPLLPLVPVPQWYGHPLFIEDNMTACDAGDSTFNMGT